MVALLIVAGAFLAAIAALVVFAAGAIRSHL
jgi:hypothetical protein